MKTLQSLTGKYRGLQGNPYNENRDPAMRTGVPCNENRVFPVRIDLQGVPCKPYRVWVCSAALRLEANPVLSSYNSPKRIIDCNGCYAPYLVALCQFHSSHKPLWLSKKRTQNLSPSKMIIMPMRIVSQKLFMAKNVTRPCPSS